MAEARSESALLGDPEAGDKRALPIAIELHDTLSASREERASSAQELDVWASRPQAIAG